MTQRNLVILLVVMVVCSGLFYLSQPQSNNRSAEGEKLFADVDGEKIKKIKIEQGKEVLEIELHEGKWGLPARAHYPADLGKIKALILKLFDLAPDQRITENAENFEKLGVSEKSIAEGRTRLTLLDGSGGELAKLYLGESRKPKGDMPTMGGGGQYVRREGSKIAYLVGESISVPTAVSNWLSADLLNVLQSNLENLKQYKLATGGEQEELELSRASSAPAGSSSGLLQFTGKLAPNESVRDSSLSLVRSGLENLRFTDVAAASDPKMKDLAFDTRSVYRSSDALQYSIESVASGDKYYLRLKVSFDPDLAKNLKAKFEESQKKAEAEKPKGDAPKEVDSKPAEAAAPPLKLSTPEEAGMLSKKFEGWVFEVPQYVASRFRQTRGDLIEKKDSAEGKNEDDAKAKDAKSETKKK